MVVTSCPAPSSDDGNDPQQRAVWVKPWTSTTREPLPTRSNASGPRRDCSSDTWANLGSRAMSQLAEPDADEPVELVAGTFAATLVDEWVRQGIRHAVICPGSRSTPVAVALAEHHGIDLQVH